MSKLGYTWYPKDWGNSESVFELTLEQRGLYRELIDLAMLNDNKTIIKEVVWSRKWAVTLCKLREHLDVLTQLGLIQVDFDGSGELFIPSCEPRLNLSRGGRNGGKKSKPTPKPIGKPTPKPTPKQREKKEKLNIKEKERESNSVFSFKNSLLNYGFEKKLVEDWMLVRKTKKATNTETAFKSFIEEIEKTGENPNTILKICVEKDWKGFKSSWEWKERKVAPKERDGIQEANDQVQRIFDMIDAEEENKNN